MAEYTMPEEKDFIDSWACAHVRHELNSEQTKKEAREFLARIRRDAAREALDGLADQLNNWAEVAAEESARIYRDTHYPEETP